MYKMILTYDVQADSKEEATHKVARFNFSLDYNRLQYLLKKPEVILVAVKLEEAA
jgi:hypothetical protein